MTTTSTADLSARYNHDTNQADPWHTDHATAVEMGWLSREDRGGWRYSPTLDESSEPHPWLDALMHDALLGIYLRSDGGTASLRERVTSSATANAPRSGLWQDIDEIERDYKRSRTHRQRLHVIKRAQEVGVALARPADRAKRKGTPEWKAAICADPRSSRDCAKDYGVHYSTITRIRKEAASVAA